ncbi:MAG: helix-turn-helix domain-containing protein [Acidimicrobiia bacterium]|nr:helix-turn-helix domain-containing protein [Acidimicrobiia bacterium]
MHPALEMIKPLAAALGGTLVGPEEVTDSDIALEWEGRIIGGYRSVGLDGALDRLVTTVERELGRPINELNRAGKQEAVRRLEELGAFNLRRAVEDIADRLQVSRFTVYNYLNASTRALPDRPPAPPPDPPSEGRQP